MGNHISKGEIKEFHGTWFGETVMFFNWQNRYICSNYLNLQTIIKAAVLSTVLFF